MPQTVYVTIGGLTFSNGPAEEGVLHLAEGGFDPNLITLFQKIVELTDAMKGVVALSQTAITPGAGSHVFTLLAPASWETGQVVRAVSASDATHYLVGTITAIGTGPDTLTLAVAAGMHGGATEKNDWALTYPVPAAAPDLELKDLPSELSLAYVLALHGQLP